MKKCLKFGIAVHLVTGDGVSAAESVAVRCGIVGDRDKSDVLDATAFEARIRHVPSGPVCISLYADCASK